MRECDRTARPMTVPERARQNRACSTRPAALSLTPPPRFASRRLSARRFAMLAP
jgi:hypothetical protein